MLGGGLKRAQEYSVLPTKYLTGKQPSHRYMGGARGVEAQDAVEQKGPTQFLHVTITSLESTLCTLTSLWTFCWPEFDFFSPHLLKANRTTVLELEISNMQNDQRY